MRSGGPPNSDRGQNTAWLCRSMKTGGGKTTTRVGLLFFFYLWRLYNVPHDMYLSCIRVKCPCNLAGTLILSRPACGLIQSFQPHLTQWDAPPTIYTSSSGRKESKSRLMTWNPLLITEIFPPLDLPSLKVLFSPFVSIVASEETKKGALPFHCLH